MNTLTYNDFKSDIENTLDSVMNTHLPIMIKKNRKSSVVVIPLEDYQSLIETKYLLGSPKNAIRLMQGIYEVEALIAKGK